MGSSKVFQIRFISKTEEIGQNKWNWYWRRGCRRSYVRRISRQSWCQKKKRQFDTWNSPHQNNYVNQMWLNGNKLGLSSDKLKQATHKLFSLCCGGMHGWVFWISQTKAGSWVSSAILVWLQSNKSASINGKKRSINKKKMYNYKMKNF